SSASQPGRIVGAPGPWGRKVRAKASRSSCGAPWADISALIAERGVEGDLGDGVVQAPQLLQGLLGAVLPVHPGVLPLDRDGPLVPDGAQRAEGGVPRDVPTAEGDEVPAAARIAPGQVRDEPGVAP